MDKTYKNKNTLKKKYAELGSTRRAGKFFKVSNGTIIYWMRKYHLPRKPRLDIQLNNSGSGRRGELYIAGHPYFKKNIIDLGIYDDKAKRDLLWFGDRVDVKTSHYKKRAIFRVKKKRHEVNWYICLYFNDEVSPLIPVEVLIIPSNMAPHSNITPGLRDKSKYSRYKLSRLREKDFSAEEEKKYNEEFEKRYKDLFDQKRNKMRRKTS
ncbi:MAG: hypothetical protein V1810_00615 [Candidatus Beckwithbacteria bacterium]